MSLLDSIADPAVWEKFYAYKTSLALPKAFTKQLRGFLDRGAYLPAAERIARGERFPLPRKSVISKMGTEKKRTVYTYPEPENTVLKLLTWLLLRRYDGLFADNLYSFRPGIGAKDAVRRFAGMPGIGSMASYKTDIHDYFNSIPVEKLLPILEDAVGEDAPLCRFLTSLLTEEEVLEDGRTVREQKGIMAGTPLSAFYANLYLADLDRRCAERRLPYARYSDDILLFAPTEEEVRGEAALIREVLAERGLTVNPAKECFGGPGDGWVFLGFRWKDGRLDIAPATVAKLKGKMRRKTRALLRWSKRNGIAGEQAARAFLRVFNRKLLEVPGDSELSWSRWFFPVVNTSESLAVIDRYAADCVRTIASGTRTKARFNVRYEDLKAMGYRSLVHEYYAFRKEEDGSLPERETV